MGARAARHAMLAAVLAAAALARPAAAGPLEDAARAYEAGDREAAGRILRDGTAGDPAAQSSLQVLALLARTAADPAEAVSLWDRVLELTPPEPLAAEAHWEKGLAAYSAGLYVAAAEEFAVLAGLRGAKFPKGRALLWKGLAELGADQPEAALETLREAERSASGADEPTAQFALAGAYYRMGQMGEALRRYQKFERDHRDDDRAAAAARRTVECLRLLGKEQEAAARAAHIEEEYPSSFEATLAREAVRARAAKPEPAAAGEAVRWIVQVAALTDPANATKLASDVRALNVGVVDIQRAEGPEGVVHRVIVGPFDDEAAAQAAADSVAALGELSPRVRQEPKE